MRKHYIDNIRSLGILLLFPYHTFMIYNGFESFYVHGDFVRACNDFILITGIWFMPLLFLIAGMSSFLALQKRNWREYLNERFFRLFVPLFFGVLLIVPVQTYYAERYHNNYQGGYFTQYILFFTKPTDLSGYSGGFTPGHLWFLLYLFIIALLALPIMLKLKNSKTSVFGWFNNPARLLLLFIPPFILSPVLDIGGKSMGQFFAYVLIGFLLIRQDEILDMVEKYRLVYLILTALLSAAYYFIYYKIGRISRFSTADTMFSAFRFFIAWISILAILGYGKKYLNFSNRITAYFSRAAFPVYIFHQTWVVAIGYYVLKATGIHLIQIVSIMLLSFTAIILTYEIFRRIPVTRFMFGIRKQSGASQTMKL